MFIAITETHLDQNVLTAEIDIDNYQIFRSDRADRKCGGVALYVKESYGSCEEGKFSNGTCECLVVRVEKIKTIIITCYRPPNCSLADFDEVLTFINEHISKVNQNTHSIIFNGDFNLPFIQWTQSDCRDDVGSYTIGNGSGVTLADKAQAEKLLDLTDNSFLTQIVDRPTRKKNILDLCFVSAHENVKCMEVNDTAISDHRLVEITLDGKVASDSNTHSIGMNKHLESFRELNFYNKKVNWNQINENLLNENWHHLIIESASSVQEAKSNFDKILLKHCQKNVPRKRSQKKRGYFHAKRKVLMSKRTQKCRQLAHESCPHRAEQLNNCLVEIETQIKSLHDRERAQNEVTAIENIKTNSRYFFSYAAKFSTAKSKIGPFVTETGDIVDNNMQMSEMLSAQYSSQFTYCKQSNTVNKYDRIFFKN